MSRAVETTVEIDGTKIKKFSSLKLSQEINAHHSFRLVCPVEAVEGDADNIFIASKSLIGTPVNIQVTSDRENATLLFSGLVTQVEVAGTNGQPGNYIITGFSPTILLDNGPQCRSWMRQSVKSMIKDVVEGFPSELLTYKIAPSYQDTIYYIVQYKETSWQFINRIANRYGEWLYYDGQQLVVGAPRGNPVHLTHGVQLSKFAMSIQIKPNDLRAKAYDYVSNEVYDSQIENIAGRAGHNELGAYAVEKSTQLYGTDSNYWYNHFVRNKKQVDEFTGTRAAMRSSDLVRMHGSSDMPGLQPGSMIAVKDPQGQSGGEFTIISIEHCWDGIGNYANEFIAIPASVKVPPLVTVNGPYCEMQSAVVVDNHDDTGMGRVRVKFRWMEGTEKSPWLRVVTSYAGDGKGMFFLPEKDEEVLVTFAGGDATRPYVIGTVRHGKSIIGYGNEGNDIKAIHTRSGIKIVMNDETGGIYIEDKNGDKLEFNGEGNIKLLSKNKITFDCGDSKIEMDKDGTIKISAIKIDMEATEETTIDAKTKVKVESAMITLN